MKPHPRIRKTIKWGGAAVTVLLVVVWIGSGWWTAWWNGDETAIWITRGQIAVQIENSRRPFVEPPPRGWEFERKTTGFRFDAEYKRWEGDSVLREVRFPFWPLALATLLCTSVAWRLDTLARRRAGLDLCPKCNYDRTGLASKDAKCPECGAVPASV